MSVHKNQRKESKFNVLINMTQVRKELLDLCKRKFGFNEKRAIEAVNKEMGCASREELTPEQQDHWDLCMSRIKGEVEWHVPRQRDTIETIIKDAHLSLFRANSMYPTTKAEAEERRINQNKAIASLETILIELQFVLELFPIDVKTYRRLTRSVDEQINLIKRWRKADNGNYKGLL